MGWVEEKTYKKEKVENRDGIGLVDNGLAIISLILFPLIIYFGCLFFGWCPASDKIFLNLHY